MNLLKKIKLYKLMIENQGLLLLLNFGYFVKYYFFEEKIFDHMLNNYSHNHQKGVLLMT